MLTVIGIVVAGVLMLGLAALSLVFLRDRRSRPAVVERVAIAGHLPPPTDTPIAGAPHTEPHDDSHDDHHEESRATPRGFFRRYLGLFAILLVAATIVAVITLLPMTATLAFLSVQWSGWLREVALLVLVAITVAAIVYPFSSTRFAMAVFSVIVLIGLTSSMWEQITTTSWCRWGWCQPTLASDQQTADAPSQVAAQCSGQWKEIQIGTSPTVFNPGGACVWDAKHPAGCIFVRRADWTGDSATHGPFCPEGHEWETKNVAPNDVAYMWAERPIGVLVQLLPPQR